MVGMWNAQTLGVRQDALGAFGISCCCVKIDGNVIVSADAGMMPMCDDSAMVELCEY